MASAPSASGTKPTYTPRDATDTDLTIADDVGPLTSLKPFDIRNGEVDQAHSLLVKATISSNWHWRPIADLPPGDSIKCVAAYIRTYRVAVSTLPADAYPQALKDKVAIVLGVARAVLTATYGIEDGDLIPGEKANALLRATRMTNGNYKFVYTTDANAASQTILAQELNLTEDQKAIVAAVHMCALGVLPLQGYSLVMCSHHYLSDKGTQSFRAFNVVEKQHMSSTSVSTWWNENLEQLRDALWHKVGHPVSISLKQSLAQDPEVARKLQIVGCGSAASRLPAIESELRAANSYKTLLQTVRGLFESYNGYLNYVALDDAINSVHQFKVGRLASTTQYVRPPTVPEWVVTRETALNYLDQMLKGHQDIVAFCYGFYCALSDATEASTGMTGANTLKTSFALKKLENQSTASYVAGRESYGDYAAAKRAARNEGRFNPPIYVFQGGVPLDRDQVPIGIGVQLPPVGYTPGGPPA